MKGPARRSFPLSRSGMSERKTKKERKNSHSPHNYKKPASQQSESPHAAQYTAPEDLLEDRYGGTVGLTCGLHEVNSC